MGPSACVRRLVRYPNQCLLFCDRRAQSILSRRGNMVRWGAHPMTAGDHLTPGDLRTGARAKLLATIEGRPGIAFLDLVDVIGPRHNGATAHHLGILKRARLVQMVRAGRFRRYFVYDPALPSAAERARTAFSMNPVTGDILRAVESNPGATQTAVAARFQRVSRQNVAYHLARLEGAGLLCSWREGAKRLYAPVQTPLPNRTSQGPPEPVSCGPCSSPTA